MTAMAPMTAIPRLYRRDLANPHTKDRLIRSLPLPTLRTTSLQTTSYVSFQNEVSALKDLGLSSLENAFHTFEEMLFMF